MYRVEAEYLSILTPSKSHRDLAKTRDLSPVLWLLSVLSELFDYRYTRNPSTTGALRSRYPGGGGLCNFSTKTGGIQEAVLNAM
jgi:hypothetical protein